MMAKRNLIQEVQAIKSRERLRSNAEFILQLDGLIDSYQHINAQNEDLIKYLPIATVACFEAYYKSIIKEFVDFGKPYSDNITKFNQSNIKLDFDVLLAIQSRFFTLGDFVSHLLSFNNLNDINGNISLIAGKDFLKSIKGFKSASIFKDLENEKYFNKNYDLVISSVNRVFELRHIFCHEFNNNITVDLTELLSLVKNCKAFLLQSGSYFYKLLYPDIAETQSEMNIQSYEQYDASEKELNELIQTIQAIEKADMDRIDEKVFNKSIIQWRKYRLLHAEYTSNGFKGGSIHPLIYNSDMLSVTNEKIQSLKKEFGHLLKDIS